MNTLTGLRRVLDELASDRAGSTSDIREFANSLISKFGGIDELAQTTFEIFEACPKGSPSQVQLLKNVLTIIERCTDFEAVPENPEDLSDEKLEYIASTLAGEFDDDRDPPLAEPVEANGSQAAIIEDIE